MQIARPYFAPHPFRFGRGRVRQLDDAVAAMKGSAWMADVKLFATTFAAGFLFVSMVIG